MAQEPEVKEGWTADDRARRALEDPRVPRVYCNSFMIKVSSADLTLFAEANGQSTAVVNMSYTLAKTLAQKLGYVIAQLEARTGQEMLTSDAVDLALAGVKEPKK